MARISITGVIEEKLIRKTELYQAYTSTTEDKLSLHQCSMKNCLDPILKPIDNLGGGNKMETVSEMFGGNYAVIMWTCDCISHGKCSVDFAHTGCAHLGYSDHSRKLDIIVKQKFETLLDYVTFVAENRRLFRPLGDSEIRSLIQEVDKEFEEDQHIAPVIDFPSFPLRRGLSHAASTSQNDIVGVSSSQSTGRENPTISSKDVVDITGNTTGISSQTIMGAGIPISSTSASSSDSLAATVFSAAYDSSSEKNSSRSNKSSTSKNPTTAKNASPATTNLSDTLAASNSMKLPPLASGPVSEGSVDAKMENVDGVNAAGKRNIVLFNINFGKGGSGAKEWFLMLFICALLAAVSYAIYAVGYRIMNSDEQEKISQLESEIKFLRNWINSGTVMNGEGARSQLDDELFGELQSWLESESRVIQRAGLTHAVKTEEDEGAHGFVDDSSAQTQISVWDSNRDGSDERFISPGIVLQWFRSQPVMLRVRRIIVGNPRLFNSVLELVRQRRPALFDIIQGNKRAFVLFLKEAKKKSSVRAGRADPNPKNT